MGFREIFFQMVSFGCFKLREIFETIQKSNNDLRKKLRKFSTADDTFNKLKVAEDINKSNPMKRVSSGENIRIEGSPCLWRRTAPDSYDPKSGREYDEYSALNDEDFWLRVSKERAEFNESKQDKTVKLNRGNYKNKKYGPNLKVSQAHKVEQVQSTLYSPGHPAKRSSPNSKSVVRVAKSKESKIL